jgi:glycosyltransferase involved in cell wall biosynthesis
MNLAKSMVDAGLSVDIVSVNSDLVGFDPHLLASVRKIDCQSKQTILALPKLINYLRQERPHVAISCIHHMNIVALWSKFLARVPTKLIVTVHNNLSDTIMYSGNVKNRFLPWFVHFFYAGADKIVAVSQGVADDLAKIAHLPRNSIQVIYNPVVTSDLLQRITNDPIEHEWFMPGSVPVIISVGRLAIQKDFPTLIQAFAIVRQQLPCRLMIVGEGSDRQRLEALVKQLELETDVSLPGFVEHPFAYMAKAKVFVLSSKWEGLGNVIIEAMAAGTTIVATDCQSGPSEILENGKYGYLVPVDDVQALAEAILISLQKPFVPELLKHRAMDFSLEKGLHSYLRLIEECMSGESN